jgi:hypothetical protein
MNTNKHRLKRRRLMSVLLKSLSVFLGVCLWLPLIAGCGPGNPLGRVAVAGKIALDGVPLSNGNIRFMQEKSGGVSTGAVIAADGTYQVDAQHGLPPGKYRVEIYSGDDTHKVEISVPTGGMPPPAVERIPEKYNIKTELTIDVTAGGVQRFNFDLKSK